MRARRFCAHAAPSRIPKSLHVRLGPANTTANNSPTGYGRRIGRPPSDAHSLSSPPSDCTESPCNSGRRKCAIQIGVDTLAPRSDGLAERDGPTLASKDPDGLAESWRDAREAPREFGVALRVGGRHGIHNARAPRPASEDGGRTPTKHDFILEWA